MAEDQRQETPIQQPETKEQPEQIKSPQPKQEGILDQSDPQVRLYFQNRSRKLTNKANLVSPFIIQSEKKMNSQIKKGGLKEQKPVSELVLNNALNREEEKRNHMIVKKGQLQEQIRKLQMELQGDQRSKEKEGRSRERDKKQDHKKFIQKVSKQNRAIMMKRKLVLEQSEKKKIEEQSKKQSQLRQKQQKNREQKQKIIRQKISEGKQRKQKMVHEQQQSIKRLKAAQEQKRTYQTLQEKYKKTLALPLLEQKKKFLKQKRQFNRAYDVDQINNFQKDYLKKKQQKQSKQKESPSWVYKPPPKNQRIAKLIENQKIQQKIKLQQKKRVLEDRIIKQQNFVRYLRQKFPVRIDEKKRQQIELLLKKQEIARSRPKIDVLALGNDYLQQSKKVCVTSRPRKNLSERQDFLISEMKKSKTSANRTQKQQTFDQGDSKQPPNTSDFRSRNQQQFLQMQNKKLDKLLSSGQIDKVQKISRLKIQLQKLTERQKRQLEMSKITKQEIDRSQSLDMLLTSIKAKIGIIQLYRN